TSRNNNKHKHKSQRIKKKHRIFGGLRNFINQPTSYVSSAKIDMNTIDHALNKAWEEVIQEMINYHPTNSSPAFNYTTQHIKTPPGVYGRLRSFVNKSTLSSIISNKNTDSNTIDDGGRSFTSNFSIDLNTIDHESGIINLNNGSTLSLPTPDIPLSSNGIYAKIKVLWNDLIKEKFEMTTTEATQIELKELLIQFNQVFNQKSRKYSFKKLFKESRHKTTVIAPTKKQLILNLNNDNFQDKFTTLIPYNVYKIHGWSGWGPCTVKCGEGFKTRKLCPLETLHYKDCQAKMQQFQLCMKPSCDSNNSATYNFSEDKKLIVKCPIANGANKNVKILRWYKGDHLLTALDLKFKSYKNSIMIDNALINDTGLYHCVGVSSKTQIVTGDIILNILDCRTISCENGICIEIPKETYRSFKCICLPGNY
ncbi:unnamed protein product, partial [Gordionus sp. m RMFG-2023]